jgi:hypothetical protein
MLISVQAISGRSDQERVMATFRIIGQPWDALRPVAVEQDQGGVFVPLHFAATQEEAGKWLDAYLAGPVVLEERQVA